MSADIALVLAFAALLPVGGMALAAAALAMMWRRRPRAYPACGCGCDHAERCPDALAREAGL